MVKSSVLLRKKRQTVFAKAFYIKGSLFSSIYMYIYIYMNNLNSVNSMNSDEALYSAVLPTSLMVFFTLCDRVGVILLNRVFYLEIYL